MQSLTFAGFLGIFPPFNAATSAAETRDTQKYNILTLCEWVLCVYEYYRVQQYCPSTAKEPNSHIDYFEITVNYCTGPPLTYTLNTNFGVAFQGFRTLN